MKASIAVAVSRPIPYSLKSIPQIPSLLGVCGQACLNYPK